MALVPYGQDFGGDLFVYGEPIDWAAEAAAYMMGGNGGGGGGGFTRVAQAVMDGIYSMFTTAGPAAMGLLSTSVGKQAVSLVTKELVKGGMSKAKAALTAKTVVNQTASNASQGLGPPDRVFAASTRRRSVRKQRASKSQRYPFKPPPHRRRGGVHGYEWKYVPYRKRRF